MVSFSQKIEKYPWRSLGLYILISGTLYVMISSIEIYPSFVISPTWIDTMIPLIPSTALIYLSYFLLMPSFVLLYHENVQFGKMFITVCCCVMLNLSINFLFPSKICLASNDIVNSGSVLSFIRSVDHFSCAFPSGHISLPACLFFVTWSIQSSFCWIYFVWLMVLAVVTLTTKQHYFPDIIGGFALGAAVGCFPALKNKQQTFS